MDIDGGFIGREFDYGLDEWEGETFPNIFDCCSQSVEEVLITDNVQNWCKGC